MTASSTIRPAQRLCAIVAATEWAGRQIMDAFGLGAAIDKIEEYLGRKIAAMFVVLATLAASVLFVYVIVDYGIIPVASFLKDASSQPTLHVLWQLGIATIAAALCALTWVACFHWVISRRTTRLVEHAEKSIQEAEKIRAEARQALLDLENAMKKNP